MNLDWDVDRDHDMQTEDQQFLLGSSQFQCQNRDMDLVRWQGSQTSSKALNELMQEASKPTRKSPRNHRIDSILIPSWTDSADDASTSMVTPTHKSKSRVPRSRNRHAPSTPNSFLGNTTPAHSISPDPVKFLMTLKGVSEKVRVDESRLGLGKKRAIANGPIAKPNWRGNEKENLRRTASDVESPPSVLVKPPVTGHRSLPNLHPGMDVDIEMVNEGSSGMDIDTDEGHAGTRTPCLSFQRVMPPPPVPLAKLKLLQSDPVQVQGPVTPNSKPKSITPPTPISPPKQHPSTAPPPPQSQRPPALGMRRHRPPVNSSQKAILPERRKGFKVPIAKPKLEQEQEDTLPTPKSSQHTAKKKLNDPQPTTVKKDEPDADSSFDLSFDMDADALEETMRKYD